MTSEAHLAHFGSVLVHVLLALRWELKAEHLQQSPALNERGFPGSVGRGCIAPALLLLTSLPGAKVVQAADVHRCSANTARPWKQLLPLPVGLGIGYNKTSP